LSVPPTVKAPVVRYTTSTKVIIVASRLLDR
jgi:hypothetical protein